MENCIIKTRIVLDHRQATIITWISTHVECGLSNAGNH